MAAENNRLPSADQERPALHWAVVMNHRLRTVAGLALFLLIGLHQYDREHGPLFWLLLVLLFLVYPHLAYWRARRSSDPVRADIQNMLLDNLMIGAWTAALGFPIWIGFPLCIIAVINVTAFRGVRGMLQALGAIAVGMLVAVGFGGWHFAPQTSWPVTAIGMLTLAGYLLLFTLNEHKRALKLQETRAKLHQNEQALQQHLLEINALQLQFSEQANRDPLTGLHNRRYLDTAMTRELQRCERDGVMLNVLLIDLDHFKHINDAHGHAAGDLVLRELAALLEQQTRRGDVVCRYGGEEFLLLLPRITPQAAWKRAEQYRLALQNSAIPWDDDTIHTTLSAGIACFPQHGRTMESLIQAADQALYRAKASGRNRVLTADMA